MASWVKNLKNPLFQDRIPEIMFKQLSSQDKTSKAS
jgi:hypothetical protein